MTLLNIDQEYGCVDIYDIDDEFDMKELDDYGITKTLNIWSGSRKSLIVPDGATSLVCPNIGLEELVLPESCVWVDVSNNKLKRLHISGGMIDIDASNNQLESLTSDAYRLAYLKYMDIRNNRLKTVGFTISDLTERLNVGGNELVSMGDWDPINCHDGDWSKYIKEWPVRPEPSPDTVEYGKFTDFLP